jgi:hypothetical protein
MIVGAWASEANWWTVVPRSLATGATGRAASRTNRAAYALKSSVYCRRVLVGIRSSHIYLTSWRDVGAARLVLLETNSKAPTSYEDCCGRETFVYEWLVAEVVKPLLMAELPEVRAKFGADGSVPGALTNPGLSVFIVLPDCV